LPCKCDIFGYPTGTTRYDPAVNGGKLGHVSVTLEMTEGKGTDWLKTNGG
jgi:hypothetical protein